MNILKALFSKISVSDKFPSALLTKNMPFLYLTPNLDSNTEVTMEDFDESDDDFPTITDDDYKRSIVLDLTEQSFLSKILLPFTFNLKEWSYHFNNQNNNEDMFEKDYFDNDFWNYLSGSIKECPLGIGYQRSQN